MKKVSSIARANPPIPKCKSLPTVLSQREVLCLLKGCLDLREKTLLGILYDSGMRKGEVLSLETGDLDLDRGLTKQLLGHVCAVIKRWKEQCHPIRNDRVALLI